MDVIVAVPGAEPFSALGSGARGQVGIVVVHGFTANPTGTRPLGMRLAAAGYSVEVPLLPGHGTSARDPHAPATATGALPSPTRSRRSRAAASRS